MRNKRKNQIKVFCTVILAFSLLLSNAQIIFAENSMVENKVSEKWKLLWSDEFNDEKLNMDNWSYEVGNWIIDDEGNKIDSGWGNNEKQYYTAGENISFRDGNMVITANNVSENKEEYDNCDYTSTRIKTQDKVTTKYGRIEARMKLPEGTGLWPAFWMMPNEDQYGGWAASGEIDIMEARGRVLDEVEGTLHYGGKWPNNKSSGNMYKFEEGTDITDFHEYAIEWEPGEIRWYVDGKLYQTQNNWNTNGNNEELKYSFPAPFDQEFYIIFNLAVGGWFDNGNLPDENFESAEMLVDYVRVYDLAEGYEYQEPKEPNLEKEELPDDSKVAIDGNYVYDINYEDGFNKIINGDEEFSNTWNFLTLKEFGGEASIATENIDNKEFAKIDIINSASVAHSVQLIQNVTLAKGRTYKLSYEAKSNSNRNIAVKLSGGADRGWTVYSDIYSPMLTTEIKQYEHIFTMEKDTDVNARLEFNIGIENPSVWIGNVKLEEVDITIDYDAMKKPLSSGNHIYNGTFDRGNIDRKTYWNLSGNAEYSVAEDTRELYVNVRNGGTEYEDVVLNQKGIMLVGQANHKLSFNARATENKDIQIAIKNNNGEKIFSSDLNIGKEDKRYTILFNFDNNGIDNNGIIEFLLGSNNLGIYIDNVVLECDGDHEEPTEIKEFLIYNGTFENGLDG